MGELHLYKVVCWQSGQYWHCNDIKNMSGRSAKWYTPMRILGLTVEEYVDLLINKFNAKALRYYAPTDYLGFHFETEKEAKAFCNYINKEARRKNYNCK